MRLLILLALSVIVGTGCVARDFSADYDQIDSQQLQAYSNVLATDVNIVTDLDGTKRDLLGTGYFNQNDNANTTIKIYGRKIDSSGTFSYFITGLTLGIVPGFTSSTYRLSFDVTYPDGRRKSFDYEYDVTATVAFWPVVYLFGKRGNQYSEDLSASNAQRFIYDFLKHAN
ncbi:hypothetical protein JF50_10195 [Pseudoalteromonas luteoviolacea]|uniref:Lipoprotein n=1 Tax=Pseudoalteromonas luteoviolacea TaxID=43657 RepID=A0A0C1MS58_9GAMM|nr:hypothetical protein [Pseudoalteromonas luteoviolacea]KID57548.1 hypothetical protein JF50_10195 [Pseudoalteromonas luteoviolacea]